MTLVLPASNAPAGQSTAPPPAHAERVPWQLQRLAELLGVTLTPRQILNALPHAVDHSVPAAILGAARRLGFGPQPWTDGPRHLPGSILPALWIRPDGAVGLVVGHSPPFLLVEQIHGAEPEWLHVGAFPGRLIVFAGPRPADPAVQRPLLQTILHENARPIAGLFALSLLSSMVSLALGLTVMIAFDMVVPSGDPLVLAILGLGAVLALAGDIGTRIAIASGIARVAERAERQVLGLVFEKAMRLPWRSIAAQDPAAQVARMREIEAVREMFSGPLPTLLIQLPLMVVFLLAIWSVAGLVVVVPLVLLPFQLLAGAVLVPRARAAERDAARLSAERRSMVLDTLSHLTTLRQAGAEQPWLARFRGVSAAAVMAQARAARAGHMVEAVAQAGMPIAAAGMAAVGAALVIKQTITPGALVTATMLAWRVLAPMQSFLLAASRGKQMVDAMRQLHRLQQMQEEPRPPTDAPPPILQDRALRFEQVHVRLSPTGAPVLANVSLTLEHGARIGVTGPSGSGKSTLLRVALGLLPPQSGAVTLGRVNIAQFDPTVLRDRMGYLSQQTALIYGTVAQNLRLAAPNASDEELTRVCAEVGVLPDILALAEGFETRLNDIAKEHLPQSFRQSLGLCQALLRRPQILLLDDPTRSLDRAREAKLNALLDRLHGEVTVLLVTQRLGLLRQCDAAYVLDRGQLLPAELGDKSAGGPPTGPGRPPSAPPGGPPLLLGNGLPGRPAGGLFTTSVTG